MISYFWIKNSAAAFSCHWVHGISVAGSIKFRDKWFDWRFCDRLGDRPDCQYVQKVISVEVFALA